MSRTRLLLLTLFLTMNCASSQIPAIPPPPADPPLIFIVPATEDDARELCVEKQFGDGPMILRWDCLTIGELRGWVRNIKRADNN